MKKKHTISNFKDMIRNLEHFEKNLDYNILPHTLKLWLEIMTNQFVLKHDKNGLNCSLNTIIYVVISH